jgi:hypothetical protein
VPVDPTVPPLPPRDPVPPVGVPALPAPVPEAPDVPPVVEVPALPAFGFAPAPPGSWLLVGSLPVHESARTTADPESACSELSSEVKYLDIAFAEA